MDIPVLPILKFFCKNCENSAIMKNPPLQVVLISHYVNLTLTIILTLTQPSLTKPSVADPDPFDKDPDPAFHLETDPDPAFQSDTDPDPIV
jgi:hypothetical protein